VPDRAGVGCPLGELVEDAVSMSSMSAMSRKSSVSIGSIAPSWSNSQTAEQPLARALMVAGLIAVLALKSKSARVLGWGEAYFVNAPQGPLGIGVVALGEQQFGQERP
jgi:hypothetical protein